MFLEGCILAALQIPSGIDDTCYGLMYLVGME
jgi:hypothetical protein